MKKDWYYTIIIIVDQYCDYQFQYSNHCVALLTIKLMSSVEQSDLVFIINFNLQCLSWILVSMCLCG